MIYDPTTHLPFPGNQIPATQLDKAALGLLKYFPLPSLFRHRAELPQLSSSTPNNNNNVGVRLNAPLTNKDRLNFNIQYQNREFGIRAALRIPRPGHRLRAERRRRLEPQLRAALQQQRQPDFQPQQQQHRLRISPTPPTSRRSWASPALRRLPSTTARRIFPSPISAACRTRRLRVTHNQTTNFTDTITYVLQAQAQPDFRISVPAACSRTA